MYINFFGETKPSKHPKTKTYQLDSSLTMPSFVF